MMGLWIVIAIVLFVLGSIMALKPSGIDMRLDTLRMTARKLELHPKLVACPDWVAGKDGEFGSGMIGQYGLVLDGVKLPQSRYKVIEGQWRPVLQPDPPKSNSAGQISTTTATSTGTSDSQASLPFALDKSPLDLPQSIEPFVKALSTQANSILIYWEDAAYVRPATNPAYRADEIQADLLALKAQLGHWALQLQAAKPAG